MFAMSEDVYGNNLAGGYGRPIYFTDAINLGDSLDEIELFSTIYDSVIEPGVR